VARAAFLASLPRRRLATGAIFRDEYDRVLLVEPTYRDRWQLPGGLVEADESPRDGCLREVAEELGLVVSLGRMLAMTWQPPGPDDPHGALMIDYDGGLLTGEQVQAITLPASELRSWRWADRDKVAEFATTRTQLRVLEAERARLAGGVAEPTFD